MPATCKKISPLLVDSARCYLRQQAGNPTPDSEITVQVSRTASPNEWVLFYTSCDTLIRQFASRLGIPSRSVDDFTQEVWVKLLKKLPEFQYDASRARFTTWLY
ncbi:MAG: sigma factor, partial [Planctomycetota bacterium]